MLYDIPDTMMLQQRYKCIVRIGKNEAIVRDDDAFSSAVQVEAISISTVMDVALIDISDPPSFNIKTINAAEQQVEQDSYTEWLFWVTPLLEGSYSLVLKISILRTIEGKERRKELVFEKQVNISTANNIAAAIQPLTGAINIEPTLSLIEPNQIVEADTPVVFLSYAHIDKTYFDIFAENLRLQSGWTIWTDRNIEVGSNWYERIQSAIAETDIGILLISGAFLTSPFIKNNEFLNLKKLTDEKNGFMLLPVLLRDADFTRWPELATMQFFVAHGYEYGIPAKKGQMIPMASLCRFDNNNQLIPNDHLDTYFKNLVSKAGKDWLRSTLAATKL